MKYVDFREAEYDTPESDEIYSRMKNAGYELLGSGADAPIWTKDEGEVIKIIMPEDPDDAKAAIRTFIKFYDFCKEHQDIANLPKFKDVSLKNGAETFNINGKEYLITSMERLNPIPEGSFEEAMIWILSDLATKKMKWEKAYKEITKPSTWTGWSDGLGVATIIYNLSNMDRETKAEYGLLFTIMTLLYHTGRINKMGWDLHTENAMMRDDGTIVITDPWFTMNENK